METELIYISDPAAETCKSTVLSIESEEIDGRKHYMIIMNKTVLYPQGGGQPSDLGYIKRSSAVFEVEKVQYDKELGEIIHYGYIKQGAIREGDLVTVHLNSKNRLINSRYHSAGHLIDIAVKQLSLAWKPVKGYHYPKGAYVEYEIVKQVESAEREDLMRRIEEVSNELVNKTLDTKILTVGSKEELSNYCEQISDYIPANKPVRIVRYGDNLYTPCGGTHVRNSGEVGEIKIRKLKFKGNNVRISYELV